MYYHLFMTIGFEANFTRDRHDRRNVLNRSAEFHRLDQSDMIVAQWIYSYHDFLWSFWASVLVNVSVQLQQCGYVTQFLSEQFYLNLHQTAR